MPYEVLIATGRDDGADADKDLKVALVYNNSSGQKTVSDYLKPGQFSNRGNAYENGQLDICEPINFTQSGQPIDTDDFIGVMIAFTDKDWQLDTIWVTNHTTGKYLWKHADKFFGSKYDVGTEKHPYELLLNDPVTITDGAKQDQNSYDLQVSTLGNGDISDDFGTNDEVFFKLFDNTGHASQAARNPQIGNQFQSGGTDSLLGFKPLYSQLSKDIVKALIIKVGDNGWRPKSLIVKPSLLLDRQSTFLLEDHMPSGEVSLDTHHNWMTCPSTESQQGRNQSAAKEDLAEA